MIVGIPRAVVHVARPVIGLLKESEMGKAKKMGKGVSALTEVPGGLKMDPKNVRRRERAAELREAVALVASEIAKPAKERVKLPTVRMTFTGKLTEEGQRAVKAALDEPAPVRLTLAALAQAFDEACAGVDLAEGALENATRIRDKAKTALDQACARRANGEQA
jgi:hypothetical protein